MAFKTITGIQQLDFQINRVLTYGDKACNEKEVIRSLKEVRDFSSWFNAWNILAQKAENEERFLHAAYYYRMVEFYLSEKDENKNEFYNKSIKNFDKIISKDTTVEKFFVPYQGKELKTLVFSAEKEKGTIVMFGGYDSFIEEFYLTVKGLAENGYRIILFEGPGQGLSLKKQLHFEHKWEFPVSAVLDYFKLEEASLVGISWGGYLALRAAAFEKRVKRVVAYDILYDGFDCMVSQFPTVLKSLVKTLFALKQRRLVNKLMNFLMTKNLSLDWALTHGKYITGTVDNYDYYKSIEKHTLKGITDKIDCDVLLLAGEEDHYIPLKHYHILMDRLINAKSLSGRIFTKEEGGEQHCQVGNEMLAINHIIEWMQSE